IRSAELTHHGKVNSYNFALVIEKRATRATRSGLGIINNLVRQYVADVPLGGDRPDQVAAGEFFHHLLRITFGCSRDGLERFCACPSQNCIKRSRISEMHEGTHDVDRSAAIGKGYLFDYQILTNYFLD